MISNSEQSALIIFVKNLIPGKVKTRIAKSLGNDKAIGIYKVLLQFTRDLCRSVSCEKYLYYSDYINPSGEWKEEFFNKRLQLGDNLGVRMSNAFKEVLKENYCAIIIGSDCPKLTTDILYSAFSSLKDYDVVIGPALDGGYYLLGIKNYIPDLFCNIPWSTDKVYLNTMEIIKKLSLTFKVLETLPDIDSVEDWKKYGWPEKIL